MLRTLALLLALTLTLSACDDGDINLFSIQDDIALGAQLRDEVLANPQEYPILPRSQYPQAYNYLEDIRDDILASGQVRYADEFPWEVYLIDDPGTLNAFAAPGGYIFVYTGLIRFLDEKDDFVGVMGHEMAHADRRHSTDQLTKAYGISILLEVLLGNQANTQIADILASLVSLQFSRQDETEADTYSVIYLCGTEYAANGAASFFQKLTDQMGSTPVPEFLSTHPNPDNRVENINTQADERGCDTTFDSSESEWEAFQRSLP
jgi:predicted Zn-dependent protease